MPVPHPLAAPGLLREAIARDAYARGTIRLVDPDLGDAIWLVATHSGLFAVTAAPPDGAGPRFAAKPVAHGWFFGLCRHGDALYLYENCAHRDRASYLGRILRFAIGDDRRLGAGEVIATGLHGNCHQIAVIDGLLCVLDTASQAVVRLTLDGRAVDVRYPFPVVPPSDTSGAYLHMNGLAAIGDRIAVMLHNGKAIPEKTSEIAWLTHDWQPIERVPLPGHWCHDIVADAAGVLWYCDSRAGDVIASDGRRVHVVDGLMTRGLAFAGDRLIVGTCIFGPRHLRSGLRGAAVILNRALDRIATLAMDGAPADIIAL